MSQLFNNIKQLTDTRVQHNSNVIMRFPFLAHEFGLRWSL